MQIYVIPCNINLFKAQALSHLQAIHDITDTSTFRKRLKNVLFDRAYNWLLQALLGESYSGALQISRWLIDWLIVAMCDSILCLYLPDLTVVQLCCWWCKNFPSCIILEKRAAPMLSVSRIGCYYCYPTEFTAAQPSGKALASCPVVSGGRAS